MDSQHGQFNDVRIYEALMSSFDGISPSCWRFELGDSITIYLRRLYVPDDSVGLPA